jgi:hypothetical protein
MRLASLGSGAARAHNRGQSQAAQDGGAPEDELSERATKVG